MGRSLSGRSGGCTAGGRSDDEWTGRSPSGPVVVPGGSPYTRRMAVHFTQSTLSNGMRVLAEVDEAAHTAAIGFFVKAGARDEPRGLMGVSHFLEHMIFKGSETLRAEAVDAAFDDLGVSHNAFTTAELTCFHAHGLPEKLGGAAEVLSTILRPALRGDDFDAEKKVILEEIAMYADQPAWELSDRAMETFFGRHGMGHRVLGTPETIRAMTRDAMADYFAGHYAADTTVIAVAGRVDVDALTDHLEGLCGDWPTCRATRDLGLVEPVSERFTIRSPKVQQAYLMMLGCGPAEQDPRRYAARILGHALGGDDGSRLYWALIEPGLAEDAHAGFEGCDHTGLFYVSVACPAEALEEVEAVVRREMAAAAGEMTEDDLLRVKRKAATMTAMAGERPAGRMRRLGHQWLMHGEHRSLEADLAALEAVTLDDIAAAARDFPLEPSVTGVLVPGEDEGEG